MKIFVIVYGLLGLVPVTEKPGNIMALLVDPYRMKMHNGMAAMPHYPEIGLYKANAQNGSDIEQIIGLAGDDFEILDILPGDLDIPKPSAYGTERIVRFDDILGTIGLKPRATSGCLGDRPERDCKSGNHPFLAGRLKMKGGVLVRPIELTLDKVLKRLVPNELPVLERATLWGFRSVDTGQKMGAVNPYSGGILLVADVPEDKLPAKLHLSQGGDFPLSAAGTKTCFLLSKVAGLANPDTRCVMVMVMNAPFPQEIYKDVEEDHTELLYPLFENGTGHMLRAYPYRRLANSGPGNGPGNHCVGGIIRP